MRGVSTGKEFNCTPARPSAAAYGNNDAMEDEATRALKIFLLFWALFAALAGLNLYMYFTLGNKLSLIGGIICALVFLGWGVFYLLYVRRSKSDPK
jgi:hypothetical protein